MAGEDEGFLKRWSRLKQEGEEVRPDAPEAEPSPPPAEAAADQGGEPGEVPAQDLELPDIESLDKDSDYTVFLREGVPDALRRLALRKLWLSDPVLANIDGLNDYDENFAALFQSVGDAARKVSDAAKKLGERGQEEGHEERPEEVAAAEEGEAPEADDDGPAEAVSAGDAEEAAAPAPARKPTPG